MIQIYLREEKSYFKTRLRAFLLVFSLTFVFGYENWFSKDQKKHQIIVIFVFSSFIDYKRYLLCFP